MKKVVLSAAVAALTLSGGVFAASVTGTANVNIIAALAITETTEIDFGNIAAVDGTCTMDAAGALSGSNADLNCTGTATPAVFDLAGAATEAVDISVTAGAAVGGVTYNPTIAGGATSVLLDGGEYHRKFQERVGGIAVRHWQARLDNQFIRHSRLGQLR